MWFNDWARTGAHLFALADSVNSEHIYHAPTPERGTSGHSISCGVSDAQTRPFLVQNPQKFDLSQSHAQSCSRLGFYPLWHKYTCSCMPDGGVIWFDLVGLSPRGSKMCSFSVNHLSFLNQLPHGLADDSVTKDIMRGIQWRSKIMPRFSLH